MGMFSFNGVSIHYLSMGGGQNVVLIHGLAANHAFWGPAVLLPLARAYRVTLLDLRGHGHSTMPSKGYTPAHMAEDLSRLLDHLGIHQADLIGHSFGGVVALQSALQFPERVRSLTLADTRVRTLQPIQRPQAWFESEEIIKGFEDLGLVIPRGEQEAGLWLLEQLASSCWKEVKEKLKNRGHFIPFSGWNGGNRSARQWLSLVRTTTARQEFMTAEGLTTEELSRIRQPTLVMSGEITLNRESAEGLRRCMPFSREIVIPEAGHFFPLTHPGAFVAEVTRFLNEVHRKERRNHGRAIVKIPVELTTFGGARFEAVTANVSRGGLLLETDEKLNVGSTIEMIVSPPEHPRMILKGVVVRTAEESVPNLFRFGVRLDSWGGGEASWERWLSA